MVALQALTEYAFRARLLTLTNIHVTLETPSSGDVRHLLRLTNTSAEQPAIYEVSLLANNVVGNMSGGKRRHLFFNVLR